MSRDWQVSLVAAVGCHVAVLFGVQLGVTEPVRSKPPFQIEVSLLAAPSEATPVAVAVPVVESPKPNPPVQPQEPMTEVRPQPEPVRIKLNDLVSTETIQVSKPVQTPNPGTMPAPPPRSVLPAAPALPSLSAPLVGDGSSPNPGREATTTKSKLEVRARPAYLKNPEPPYPPTARRRRQEGLVLLRVTVTAGGRASRVTLKETSGVAALDEAALRAVRGWEFEPARLGSLGIESEIEVPVRFKLF